MTEPDEGGIRLQRGEFVRETTRGEAPSDPSFEAYSDTIMMYPGWEPEANIEAQRGVGTYRPEDFFAGPEDHSGITIAYHLQRALVDGNGDPVDAITDGIQRDADNRLKNTHTFVGREEHNAGGAAGGGKRIFYVGHGGLVASGEIPFATDTALPIENSLTYDFERFMVYVVDQPSGSTTLDVESTDPSDTSQTLTIEDEGAGTTEDVALNGTTTETTTESFPGIDALSLDAETTGDVIVKDGSGNELARLAGSDSYDQGEGDLGIPALGGGSHAGSVGTPFEHFIDDSIEATTGSLGGTNARIVSSSFSFDNNVDADTVGGRFRSLYENEQTLSLDAEVFGPESNAREIEAYLQNKGIDVRWTADSFTMDLTGGTRTSSGEANKEANQGRATISPQFEFADISLASV
ncbi:hypothetical protein [Haloferax sp. ATB1]|uniref:hypothetical protein n=1 Tax=Haloferax sp. ATB1 TaxID=1508454 RepID=UPI0005B1E488|nr:hypothetical protein [Haloferax sp. ATB1]